jgi:hypothetical protein
LFSEVGRGGGNTGDVSLDVDRVDSGGGGVGSARERFESGTSKCGGVGKGYSEGVVIVIRLLSGDAVMPECHEVVSVDRRMGRRVVPVYQLILSPMGAAAHLGRKAIKGYKSE